MRYMIRPFLLICLVVLVSSCGSIGGSKGKLSKKDRATIVTHAKKQVGTPYRYGSSDPKSGLDCSGLVSYAYNAVNIGLPRSTKEQALRFKSVRKPQVGDVVFFKIDKRIVSHAGIYLGSNKMIHAPGTGRRVEVVDLSIDYWRDRLYKYGSL